MTLTPNWAASCCWEGSGRPAGHCPLARTWVASLANQWIGYVATPSAYYAGGFRLMLQHPVEPFHLELTLADGSVRTRRASEVIAVRVGAINRWRPGGDLQTPTLRVASIPEATRLGLAHASFHALITRRSSGTSAVSSAATTNRAASPTPDSDSKYPASPTVSGSRLPLDSSPSR